jgi:uncharacterized protein (DUF433 family)
VTKGTGFYGGRDPADVPAYTLPEAAWLAGVAPTTLRSWVRGRSYSTRDGEARRFQPIIVPPSGGPREALSFANVVEAHILSALRNEHKVKLVEIRRAVRYVQTKLGVDRPLARQPFETDGVHLFVEYLGKLLNVSQEGQCAMEAIIAGHLKRVEYGGTGRAIRLFPLYRDDAPRVVVVDPRRAFGRPILEGTSVPIVDILSRRRHGDSVDVLARDYRVTPDKIQEALVAAEAAA